MFATRGLDDWAPLNFEAKLWEERLDLSFTIHLFATTFDSIREWTSHLDSHFLHSDGYGITGMNGMTEYGLPWISQNRGWSTVKSRSDFHSTAPQLRTARCKPGYSARGCVPSAESLAFVPGSLEEVLSPRRSQEIPGDPRRFIVSSGNLEQYGIEMYRMYRWPSWPS